MSDDMNMNSDEMIAPEGSVAPLPAEPMIKPGMARRNVFLIIAGVIVLVAIVVFVGYALLLAGSTGSPVATPGIPAGPTTPGGTPSAPSTATAALPAVPNVEFSDIFTPRDPFKVIAPVQIVVADTSDDSSSDDSSNDDTSSADTSDILTLRDIVTVDGVLKAVVRLDGITYTLGDGEQVGSSSYSIVTVNEDSVDVLHGDESYTIMLSS